jgi:transcriptional regulator with XRE-family HTH domain
MDTLGQRMQAQRRRLGLSMKKLAQELGVCEKTIHNWENDESCFPADKLMSMCRVLDRTPNQLLGSASDLGRPAIKPMRLGFYGRPAHTTVIFEADAHTKALCGVPADAPNELAWQRWYNRIHTDDHARVNVELARLNNPRDGIFNMQYRLLGLDGVERCVIDYGCMTFDSAGEPVRLRGLMLDITEEPRTKKTDDNVRAIITAISRDHVSACLAAVDAARASASPA